MEAFREVALALERRRVEVRDAADRKETVPAATGSVDDISRLRLIAMDDEGRNVIGMVDAAAPRARGALLQEVLAQGVPDEGVGPKVPLERVQEMFLHRVVAKLEGTERVVALGEGKVGFVSPALQEAFQLVREAEEPSQANAVLFKPQAPADEVEFLRAALHLKRTVRTGWVLRGVKNPESVAEHSYGAALCAMLARSGEKDTPIDWQRATSMAIVHDLAEAIVGDLTPSQAANVDKTTLERNAMRDMLESKLAGGESARCILALWEEYERRQTPEARIVKDIDRFEMILQADTYEQEDENLDLEEFFVGVRGKIEHPRIQAWQREVESRRSARRNSRGVPAQP